MPRPPKMTTLPPAVMAEVQERLRNNGYTQSVEISQWLAELGFSISKTTVNDYSQQLRTLDAEDGDIIATMMQRRRKSGALSSSKIGLLIELGQLRVREHQILTQLANLEQAGE